MKIKSKVYGVAAILLTGALVFLGITWWMNGRDDTWLYAVCALIALTSFIPIFSSLNLFRKKEATPTDSNTGFVPVVTAPGSDSSNSGTSPHSGSTTGTDTTTDSGASGGDGGGI